MRERGIRVDHTTVFRWVQRYAPELDQRCRPYLRATNDSYRVDETYIKIKKRWYDLYRALDSTGATVDFMLSPTRDAEAAERFFRQVLQASHACNPPDQYGRQARRIPTGVRGPSARVKSRDSPRGISSPRTGSSTSCSGWPHQGCSPGPSFHSVQFLRQYRSMHAAVVV